MRRYETIIIIRPSAGEDEITGVLDKVTGIIKKEDGLIVRIDKWGVKKLAYLINKEQQGFYVLVEYAATPAAVSEIERILRIDDLALKYLTVKLQDTYTEDAVPPVVEEAAAAVEEEE
jgi:small subunit ribosomal protein S6